MNPHVKPFSVHLGELRVLLVRLAVTLCCGMLIAIPFAPHVYRWLQIPYERSGVETLLRVTQVGGGFSVFLRVTLWTGLLVSFPVLAMLTVGYLVPALRDGERRVVRKVGAASFCLFLTGVFMAYRWTVPVALRFMSGMENWMDAPAMFWEAAGYISFVLRLLLAFGIVFQLPVLVLLLAASGLVHVEQLRASRRYSITGLFVLAMFLTPPDPFTMVLMAVPLVLLFEITIWIVAGINRRAASFEA